MIFVTAYDQYALRAFDVHALDYLLKPVDPERFAGALQRARNDFMKFGQLMLNGGTWQGRRILSREFVARASSPIYKLGSRKYGYLWWGMDYPYNKSTVYAFAALGAGGQNVMVIPKLDLVIAAFSGSYASRGYISNELIPEYILPAVREGRPTTKAQPQ